MNDGDDGDGDCYEDDFDHYDDHYDYGNGGYNCCSDCDGLMN